MTLGNFSVIDKVSRSIFVGTGLVIACLQRDVGMIFGSWTDKGQRAGMLSPALIGNKLCILSYFHFGSEIDIPIGFHIESQVEMPERND